MLNFRLTDSFSPPSSAPSLLATFIDTAGSIAAMRLSKLSMSMSRNLRSSISGLATSEALPERSAMHAHHERQFDQLFGVVGIFVGDVDPRLAVARNEFLPGIAVPGHLGRLPRFPLQWTYLNRAATEGNTRVKRILGVVKAIGSGAPYGRPLSDPDGGAI